MNDEDHCYLHQSEKNWILRKDNFFVLLLFDIASITKFILVSFELGSMIVMVWSSAQLLLVEKD